VTLTDTGAHSRGFRGAHTHTRGTTVHQRSLRRRDGVARFIKAQQQAAVRPVDSLGTPRGSHSHLQTPPILRPQDKDVAIGDGRPKGHSGACEPVHADSSGKRAPMGLPSQHPHHQHHHHQRHQGDNRLGGGEPLTQFHSTLLGTPTDASRRQTRRRGATYPASFNSTGHPNRRVTDGGTAKNSTPEGQACGSGRTETRSLHGDLLLDPLVAFSGLCLALV
jgi:hypothetical protein